MITIVNIFAFIGLVLTLLIIWFIIENYINEYKDKKKEKSTISNKDEDIENFQNVLKDLIKYKSEVSIYKFRDTDDNYRCCIDVEDGFQFNFEIEELNINSFYENNMVKKIRRQLETSTLVINHLFRDEIRDEIREEKLKQLGL